MNETQLLKAARDGDEQAYAALVEVHRGPLYAHCYQMLGSVHDADDAVQEALLRAWRALARFEARSSLRTWLYTVATNVCLRMIEQRPFPRVLPLDYGPPADPHDGLGQPLLQSRELEPVPDSELGLARASPGPRRATNSARRSSWHSSRRSSTFRPASGPCSSFATCSASQGLRSRSARHHRDVGLQPASARARDHRRPAARSQSTGHAAGARRPAVRAIVDRYTEAWVHSDVDTIVKCSPRARRSRCRRS